MAYWKVKINTGKIYGVIADTLLAFNTIGTNVINLIYQVGQKSQLVIKLTVTAGKEEEVLQCIQDKTLKMDVVIQPFVTLMDKVTGYKICPDITNISVNKREI